jgi:protein-S-isoprenylcysteine O-methyltransferase Ste14
MLLNIIREEEFYPVVFTVFQISWAFVWAARHIKIRRRRCYASNKTQSTSNKRYQVVSYFLYVLQNILCVASFWSNAPLLLKVHDSNPMRFVGMLLTILATILYFKALRHLGRNYSPCFDSHQPFELISTGPYKFIQHPMYLAKLMIVVGNFVICGSLWFMAVFLYLILETIRTIANEENYLAASIQGYDSYMKRTARMIPFIF